jgi:hypothetical protein
METSNAREATRKGMKWEVEIKESLGDVDKHPTLAMLRDKDVMRLREEGRNERYITLGVMVTGRAGRDG